jgi:hypothetical protein
MPAAMRRAARRRLLSRSWCALIVAAFLTLVASGLPEFVVQLITGEAVACAMDCDGSDGQKHCPPNCSSGLCAKVAPTIPGPGAVVTVTEPVADATRLASAPIRTCHSRDTSNEIFHPPRA